MKKVLLGTSAIALAAAYTSSANAAEWEVKIGGYMEQFVAFADSDVDTVANTDFAGVDSKQDAEISFKPSITLDNGIKIGVDVQLEANSTGDTIDESFLFISGSFGRIQLGSENSARYTMQYGAPDVTFINVNSGSLTAFIPFSGTAAGVTTGADVFRGTLGSTFIENGRNNDAQRITYFTPRFAGFQLGVSYARDGNQDSNSQLDIQGEALANIVDIGANYVNSFGDFDVAVAGGYGIAFGDANDNPQVWNAGINLGFAGVTIGGSFAEQNNEGNDDGRVFDAGISYETGPWGFSFTYLNGENVDDEVGDTDIDANGDGIADNLGQFGNDETAQMFLIGAKYKLAKGVDLNAFGAYVDFEEDTGDSGLAQGDDVDGFIIGTGIKVKF
ncbi:MAG: porin [Pseudomonadota bacterium]